MIGGRNVASPPPHLRSGAPHVVSLVTASTSTVQTGVPWIPEPPAAEVSEPKRRVRIGIWPSAPH